MFIAILTYKKPIEEVDRFLQAHRDYLAEHYAAGDFIVSGPQTPRIGGVIMIKADNREAVDSIIVQNPFNINGIADYQIVEFTPTMFLNDNLKKYPRIMQTDRLILRPWQESDAESLYRYASDLTSDQLPDGLRTPVSVIALKSYAPFLPLLKSMRLY